MVGLNSGNGKDSQRFIASEQGEGSQYTENY